MKIIALTTAALAMLAAPANAGSFFAKGASANASCFDQASVVAEIFKNGVVAYNESNGRKKTGPETIRVADINQANLAAAVSDREANMIQSDATVTVSVPSVGLFNENISRDYYIRGMDDFRATGAWVQMAGKLARMEVLKVAVGALSDDEDLLVSPLKAAGRKLRADLKADCEARDGQLFGALNN